MKRRRFSVEQIVAAVKQHDLGVSATGVAPFRWTPSDCAARSSHVKNSSAVRACIPSRKRQNRSFLDRRYRIPEGQP